MCLRSARSGLRFDVHCVLHCRTKNGKRTGVYVTYGANLQARVLVKKEGEILMDVFITEELGVIKTDDVKIQMLESSLSTFHPSRCVPVHAMFLAVC